MASVCAQLTVAESLELSARRFLLLRLSRSAGLLCLPVQPSETQRRRRGKRTLQVAKARSGRGALGRCPRATRWNSLAWGGGDAGTTAGLFRHCEQQGKKHHLPSASLGYRAGTPGGLTHHKLADAPQAAEPQVGDVPLVLAPVLVAGVDVRDAGSSDQRDALVARTLGHKQHGGLFGFDGASPESVKGGGGQPGQ